MLLCICVLYDLLFIPAPSIYRTLPGHLTIERTIYKIGADFS